MKRESLFQMTRMPSQPRIPCLSAHWLQTYRLLHHTRNRRLILLNTECNLMRPQQNINNLFEHNQLINSNTNGFLNIRYNKLALFAINK